MRKRGVTESHSWSRNSILSRPILPRLRGFRSWFSHPHPSTRFLVIAANAHALPWTMHSRGMEGCRGPFGFAQDDMALRAGFADVSGFVIVAGCEGIWDSLMFCLGGHWLLLRTRESGLLPPRGFLRLGWML